jgi:hypothetical protein
LAGGGVTRIADITPSNPPYLKGEVYGETTYPKGGGSREEAVLAFGFWHLDFDCPLDFGFWTVGLGAVARMVGRNFFPITNG